MKRSLLLILVFFTAVSLFAATINATSSASQNAGTTRAVQEPVISVLSVNGVTHGVVAYMNFHDQLNAPLDGQIQFSHTTDFLNWSAPQNLPLTANGTTYEHSADPVFLEYGNTFPYPGRLYCIGTLYSGKPQYSFVSTIGAWHSDDGGATWSAPEILDNPPQPANCECPVGNPNCADRTCIFDDKPAAAVSLANGVIYVPFTRTTRAYTDALGNHPATTTVFMEEMLASRGWIAIGQIGESPTTDLAGPTPVIDPTTNICHLFMRGFDQGQPVIRTFTSGDGWIWTENTNSYDHTPDRTPAPGFFAHNVDVAGAQVLAVPFLTAKFDNAFHHIVVVYHRLDTSTGLTQVVYRRYSPFSHAWTQPGLIAANGHMQWHPTLVQLSNYNFVISYYDYTPGDPGYTVYAARQDIYSIVVENSRIFNSFFSNPAGYNLQASFNPPSARIGEYQGLTVFNDTLYASSIQIQNGVGNAWVVKFTSP